MILKIMKPHRSLVTFFCIISWITPALAETMPSPPQMAAKAWVLMSFHSGQVLASNNEREQLAPASLAKVMTSYVVGQELKAGHIAASDKVIISENAWGKKFPGSSKMFLNVGDEVTVDDLNHGVIIASGNDATVALAEHVAGHQSAFVEMMNIHAQQVGMLDSYFANPHGLDSEGQVTTAYDMALLTRSFIHELPDLYRLFKEKSFKFKNINQGNRNTLLWDTTLNIDGVKTGYTQNAGYSLISSAVQNNQRLIAVVMGTESADSRRIESKKLLTWGFRFFQDITPQFSEKELSPLKVWFGSPSTIKLEVADGGVITVPRRQREDLEYKITYNHELEAPVSKGQQVGKVEWYLNDKLLTEQPIIAAENAEEAPWYKKIIDMVWRPIGQWLASKNWGGF